MCVPPLPASIRSRPDPSPTSSRPNGKKPSSPNASSPSPRTSNPPSVPTPATRTRTSSRPSSTTHGRTCCTRSSSSRSSNSSDPNCTRSRSPSHRCTTTRPSRLPPHCGRLPRRRWRGAARRGRRRTGRRGARFRQHWVASRVGARAWSSGGDRRTVGTHSGTTGLGRRRWSAGTLGGGRFAAWRRASSLRTTSDNGLTSVPFFSLPSLCAPSSASLPFADALRLATCRRAWRPACLRTGFKGHIFSPG